MRRSSATGGGATLTRATPRSGGWNTTPTAGSRKRPCTPRPSTRTTSTTPIWMHRASCSTSARSAGMALRNCATCTAVGVRLRTEPAVLPGPRGEVHRRPEGGHAAVRARVPRTPRWRCSARARFDGVRRPDPTVRTTEVQIRDVAAVLDELGHTRIDYMKINIEGAEYDLLERMFETGWAHRVRYFLIQFHEWYGNAAHLRRWRIQRRLRQDPRPGVELPVDLGALVARRTAAPAPPQYSKEERPRSSAELKRSCRHAPRRATNRATATRSSRAGSSALETSGRRVPRARCFDFRRHIRAAVLLVCGLGVRRDAHAGPVERVQEVRHEPARRHRRARSLQQRVDVRQRSAARAQATCSWNSAPSVGGDERRATAEVVVGVGGPGLLQAGRGPRGGHRLLVARERREPEPLPGSAVEVRRERIGETMSCRTS